MSDSTTSIEAAVARVQRAVVVPKARYNSFGKFSYRSFEDIVSALKKPCEEEGVAFTMSDEIVQVGDRHYVRATVRAFFTDGREGELSATACAREAEHKTGSDDAQVTGMASSYARKYALCGLFAIDGEHDPDEAEGPSEPAARPVPQDGPFIAHCKSCGKRYQFPDAASYEQYVRNPGCCPSPLWEVE